MEMSIAMLVSALVIGITYTAYTLVIRSYSVYKTKNDSTAQMVRLDELLKKDFNRSDMILLSDSSIVFRNDSQHVVYAFKPGLMIRSGGITDSFKFEHTPMIATFEKQSVIADTSDMRSLIDDIEFSINADKENFPYHYHKTYSSANLVKYKP